MGESLPEVKRRKEGSYEIEKFRVAGVCNRPRNRNSINADGKAARRSYGVFRIDVCSRYRLWRDWRQSKVYPRLDGWGPNPVRIWTGFTDVFRDSSRRA